MWLLNTKTGVLCEFNRPEDVPGGYAILSHVWGSPEEEDTFQSVHDVKRGCERNEGRSQKFSFSNPSNPFNQNSEMSDIVGELRVTVRELKSLVSALAKRVERLESGPQPPEAHNTFQDVPWIPDGSDSMDVDSVSAHTDVLSTIPRDRLSPKICRFLIQAEQDGYEWAWADTCCINKTSSSELTEAINSMFQYYSLSDVCYAYLGDVPDDGLITHPTSSGTVTSRFIESGWHKRGWTLQELLAPQNVVFMSCNWTPLGNKYTLAGALEVATRIPTSVLRLEEDFVAMSIATRMSWAAERKTTRV